MPNLMGWRRKREARALWEPIPDWQPIPDTDADGKPIQGAKGRAHQQCMDGAVCDAEAYQYKVLHEGQRPSSGQDYQTREMRARR